MSSKGAKAMFVKGVKVVNHTVYAHAYRNARGGVVLGVSTKHRDYEWDAVLRNPGDYNWFQKMARK